MVTILGPSYIPKIPLLHLRYRPAYALLPEECSVAVCFGDLGLGGDSLEVLDADEFGVGVSQDLHIYIYTRGFPKIRDTFLGVPIRTIVFWGLYWGSPYFGKLPHIYIYIPNITPI